MALLADVTYLLKGLQRSQKQTCVLSDLSKVRERFVKELENIKGSPLTGGWEEAFLTGIDENMFLGIQLKESSRKTITAHVYVPSRRLFSAVHLEIINSLQNFLSDHLAIDDGFGSCSKCIETRTFFASK